MAILGEPGPGFTVTAQLSFPPRENPTSVPSMTLPPHPGAQTGKGRGCFGASTLLVSLLPSQAVKGAGDSGGKLLGWPPVVGRPCSSYIPYSLGIQDPGCSREKVLQWKGSGKVKRKRKDKREGGKVSMTVYNLCFFSLQTYNQEEPLSGMIEGLPLLQVSTTKRH